MAGNYLDCRYMQNAAAIDLRSAGPSNARATSWDRLLRPISPATLGQLRSKFVTGRRVLITGAGGSIGSALAHAAAASMPGSLVLLDSSENGLYQVDRSLRQAGSQSHVSLLGSVCNADLLDHALGQHEPEIIIHAAALKHVPLMEQNPFAAISNNVFGTLTLRDAAIAHPVERIVHVSTDKAVEPHSIMGASKRIAELILLTARTSTRMIVVRLCNVMGSQGSVLPMFLDQLAEGGPLTVSHPDAERYFITLDQAVAALFDSLEVRSASAVLLPDIGPAVRIVDMARHLLAIQGSSAAIEFIGLRAGDKLSEQLVSGRESLAAKSELGHPALQEIHTPTPSEAELSAALEMLRDAIRRFDLQQLLRGVQSLVPEYRPSSVILAALNESTASQLASERQA